MTQCPRCGLAQATSELLLCPRCLLSDDESEEPDPPEGLVLKQEIGRGGMGRVYRALQVRLGRDVAVKYLPDHELADRCSEARFEREARTLAQLSHPNIVAVYDYGTLASGQCYLVMEYVPGGTLRQRIPMPEAQALRVCSELCEALCYAHERGIVHRDIKPDNVLFDEAGRSKLADFGIARLLDRDASSTLTHPLQVLGTPGYLAPEAASGAAPHPRMDVFAVGVLLQVMLLGRPAAGDARGLAPDVAELVKRASNADPDLRPQNAAELGELLRRLMQMRGASGKLTAPVPSSNSLAPDELSWQRAVALTLAGATALSLHAVLVSITPRQLEASEFTAFLVFGATPLEDGRLMTQARFETMPTLIAAGGWTVAFLAYGLLRRHWRKENLELSLPDQPLSGTRALMAMAIFLNTLWVGRMALESSGAHWIVNYVPVLGGVMELCMLYLFWSAVLEALRIQRPLWREPLLWLGLALSLLPPSAALVSVLEGGSP